MSGEQDSAAAEPAAAMPAEAVAPPPASAPPPAPTATAMATPTAMEAETEAATATEDLLSIVDGNGDVDDKETGDLLGINGDGGAADVSSPSDAAAAAAVVGDADGKVGAPPAPATTAEGETGDLLGMSDGKPPADMTQTVAEATVVAGPSNTPEQDDTSVRTEESDEKTEESANESDDDDSSSSSSDADDDDSSSSGEDESSSEDDESSSSEDPSVEGVNVDSSSSSSESDSPPRSMRKSPPESLIGNGGKVGGNLSEEEEEDPNDAILTKEQVIAPLSSAQQAHALNAASASLKSASRATKPGAVATSSTATSTNMLAEKIAAANRGVSLLYGEDAAVRAAEEGLAHEYHRSNNQKRETEGESFYDAYGNVTKLMGAGSLPSEINGNTGSRSRRRSSASQPVIGQDRANVRSMVGQRLRGKGYNRSNRKGSASRKSGHRHKEHRRRSRRSRRSSGRGSSSLDMTAPHPYGGQGWSSPKKRRILYAMLATMIVLVGISLIIYGVREEREYNRSKDDDYFYNDDLGVMEGEDEYDYGGGSQPNKSPITEMRPVPPPGPTWTQMPTPGTPKPVVPSPTPPPGDTVLLPLLKQSYSDYIFDDSDTSSYYIVTQAKEEWLDEETNEYLFTFDQSPQWRAYLHLRDDRTDVINKETNELLMDTERILQIYALAVFYETFGWWPTQENNPDMRSTWGEKECQWPGVTCHGLGVHEDNPNAEDDDLRVVALNVKGNVGPKIFDSSFPLLEGELPVELMFLRRLETLDVSHNKLGGRLVGAMFGHWKNIKVLDLNDNRFEGDIPKEFGSMYFLQKLTLHHNEFTGYVPAEICQLREGGGTLHFLWVDCSPPTAPKVECPEDCCTICFEGYDSDGGPLTGGTTPSNTDVENPAHQVQGDQEQGGDTLTLKKKLMAASTDEGNALMDIGSPQFRAYAWLVEDSSKEGVDYSLKRLIQRYGLATLYFATNGMNWRNSENWITNADECTWFGISGCDDADNGKIISVSLRNNQLEGELPPEIFEFLPYVVQFNVATNELSGPIPTEIGILEDIEILELAENQFTSIPTEMGKLYTVDHVFLQSNNFGGDTMPEEVCELRNSHALTLLWADCREDDSGGAGLVCAKECCTTCFSGAASSLGSGGGDGNVFDSEGTGIGGTDAVTHADPADEVRAKLIKMSPDLGHSLKSPTSPQSKAYGWLVTTEYYKSLSDVLLLQRYGLATLYFSAAGHGWTEKEGWLTDENVCNWDSVEDCNAAAMVTELDLRSNNLVGQIPIELTHVRMLEILDLTDNELYGSIPTEFGLFEDMEILRLGGNLLTGKVPSELADMVKLQELYLHVNEFSGANIDDAICDLEINHDLHTVWADCAGDFPPVSCREGCCDECWDDDRPFEYFAGYETWSPTFSPTVSSGSSIRTFPPTISPVVSPPAEEDEELKADLLLHMDGFGERLSDTNSHAYESYMWLANTDMGLDTLEGPLKEMRLLQRFGLVTFYLSTSPELDWKISYGWKTNQHECDWFGISCAINDTVTEISLPSNSLSGTIPPEIGLAGLGGKVGKLNLFGNNIGGQLPEQLSTFTHLEVLDLRSNDFTGKIPGELGNLAMLKSLQLNANELTGDMPQEVCDLRTGGNLEELVADCDPADPFNFVTCDTNTCCTGCE